jgi:CheY-like chemotaxis protein/HPt (histidine-containing phosphotransfer) domain-containing protein
VQNKNILVVAHEAAESAVLKELLSKSSYEVIDFGNSMAAIQWVKQHGNPQLLIIEEKSAPLSGLQAMDYLRTELAMEHPVLIVIDRKNEALVSDKKMQGYLTKPYTKESILEITNFLDKVPRSKEVLSPRHYSLEYLEELGDGNRDIIIESLMIFKESVTLKLEEMQNRLALRDLEEVRKIAHNIKPSFAMLHNQKGRELCNTMMDSAKDLDMPKLVNELKLEFEIIQSQLAMDFSKEFG